MHANARCFFLSRLHRAVTLVHVCTGYGLVHGSITLDQADFPHLQFPLDLRCEWTNSNGCIPFDCYINGMPNDLTCWQTCPDPCFSIKKCNTFSKECTCQGFPVDLTYVAPIKTTTTAHTTTTTGLATTTPAHTTSSTTAQPTTTSTTAQPTTTPVPETTTPVPFTSKLQETTLSSSTTPKPTTPFPQTTPFDDHLQTCPCEAPAINPVPADRSCRDLETRDACKVSYYKRKEAPPPPLICNWHQAKGCIPWSCFPKPGDKSCWSVCTDKCMPIKTCSIDNNLECMCHWDEAVMNDPTARVQDLHPLPTRRQVRQLHSLQRPHLSQKPRRRRFVTARHWNKGLRTWKSC